jgi:hypothetical protein
MANAAPRIIGEFIDYAGLLAVVRARVNELQINGERFDEFAGLPRGYLSKLVGVRPTKRIGMLSLGPLFAALGITCVMLEDPAATARLKSRLVPKQSSFVRPTWTYVVVTNRKWARIQKLGSQARAAAWNKLSPQQRSEMMRAVVLKRWRKGAS